MSEITIHMKFFGSFRKFGESINFSMPTGSTISAVKMALQNKLNGEGLVLDSALANDDAILQDNDVLNNDAELCILPPVCGGQKMFKTIHTSVSTDLLNIQDAYDFVSDPAHGAVDVF